MTTTLYERLETAGCKLSHHESDLYVQKTPDSERIIAEYESEGGISNKTYFISQIDSQLWIDLPFHNVPFWEAKKGRRL